MDYAYRCALGDDLWATDPVSIINIVYINCRSVMFVIRFIIIDLISIMNNLS